MLPIFWYVTPEDPTIDALPAFFSLESIYEFELPIFWYVTPEDLTVDALPAFFSLESIYEFELLAFSSQFEILTFSFSQFEVVAFFAHQSSVASNLSPIISAYPELPQAYKKGMVNSKIIILK